MTDLRAVVERHFATLFEKGGFVVVDATSERQGEYQRVIAAATTTRMRFASEQDSFSLHMGGANAPSIGGDEENGIVCWHLVDLLMAFEDRRRPAEAQQPLPVEASDLDGVVSEYARAMRHYGPRLAEAFSATPPTGWWAEYDAFVASLRAGFGPGRP